MLAFHTSRLARNQVEARRYHDTYKQTIVKAEPLETQLIGWVHGFQPDELLCTFVLDAVRTEASGETAEDAARRAELLTQLERLRDLCMMGDFTKPQYVMRRQALEEELQRTKPPVAPALHRTEALFEDFGTL